MILTLFLFSVQVHPSISYFYSNPVPWIISSLPKLTMIELILIRSAYTILGLLPQHATLLLIPTATVATAANCTPTTTVTTFCSCAIDYDSGGICHCISYWFQIHHMMIITMMITTKNDTTNSIHNYHNIADMFLVHPMIYIWRWWYYYYCYHQLLLLLSVLSVSFTYQVHAFDPTGILLLFLFLYQLLIIFDHDSAGDNNDFYIFVDAPTPIATAANGLYRIRPSTIINTAPDTDTSTDWYLLFPTTIRILIQIV